MAHHQVAHKPPLLGVPQKRTILHSLNASSALWVPAVPGQLLLAREKGPRHIDYTPSSLLILGRRRSFHQVCPLLPSLSLLSSFRAIAFPFFTRTCLHLFYSFLVHATLSPLHCIGASPFPFFGSPALFHSSSTRMLTFVFGLVVHWFGLHL